MQAQIEILGFDRIGFVNDVAKEISKWAIIKTLAFEANGIKSTGKLSIEIGNHPNITSLFECLKSVKGLATVKQIEE